MKINTRVGLIGHMSEKARLARLKTALRENSQSTLEGLCEYVSISGAGLFKLADKHNIAIPDDLEPILQNPEFDEAVENGLSCDEIASIYGKTRQWAMLYVRYTGQKKRHDKAIARKNEESERLEQERKDSLTSLAKTLLLKNLRDGYNKSFGSGVALEVIHEVKDTRFDYDLEGMARVYDNYFNALDNDEKPSLNELAEGTDYYPTKVRRLLRRIGAPPLCRRYSPSATTPEQDMAIYRARRFTIQRADVAYFVGVKLHVVADRWMCHKRGGTKFKLPSDSGSTHAGRWFRWEHVSKVYEAADADFSQDEIVEYSGLDERQVNYVLGQREYLEPSLVGILQEIFGDFHHDKPYGKLTDV